MAVDVGDQPSDVALAMASGRGASPATSNLGEASRSRSSHPKGSGHRNTNIRSKRY